MRTTLLMSAVFALGCGAGSRAPSPAATSTAPTAPAASSIRLTVDRPTVSASPIASGDAPKITLHLREPAGAAGRHVTLVIDGVATSFGVDVAAGQSEATFTPPASALAKGSLSISVEGDPTSTVKLEVVRPTIRLECPSTVDARATFDLPVVLATPAPADGYRVKIRAQYSYGPAGRAPSGVQHIDLELTGGVTRSIAKPRAPNAPLIEMTVTDSLDANEVRDRCQISVRGSDPPRPGGLL